MDSGEVSELLVLANIPMRPAVLMMCYKEKKTPHSGLSEESPQIHRHCV